MWSCFVARIDGVALPPRLNETHKARLALLAERANRPASGLIALGKEWLSNMQSDLEAFIEEIKLIKDYEQAIIALSTKLSVDPQGLSALQFHLALDSLSESKPKDKGGHAKGQRK